MFSMGGHYLTPLQFLRQVFRWYNKGENDPTKRMISSQQPPLFCLFSTLAKVKVFFSFQLILLSALHYNIQFISPKS